MWTTEQVQALAPDAASNKAAQKLLKLNKWPLLAYNEAAIWGECQGSGSKPYQTRIALEEPAFKCSCPSHKFPCKHALALFLLYVQSHNAFKSTEPPPWVAEWLEGRAKRQAKKAEKANKPVDTAAQLKRTAKREEKVEAGLEELSLWLRDLVRNGLGDLQDKPYSFFEDIAARMVDAQAPGLANRLKELAGIRQSGQNWASELLEAVARLHLLVESYQRLDSLPSDLQHDIRGLIGWTQTKETVLQQAAIRDNWLVLGQYIDSDEIGQLLTQRIWLQSAKTGKIALLLNFAHPQSRHSLDYGWITGTLRAAELSFYPSAYPLRAVVKARYETSSITSLKGAASLQAAFASYKNALSQLPWIERFPMILENVTPTQANETWWLTDTSQHHLPIISHFKRLWDLLAVSGGNAITVFGEWQNSCFYPLGVWSEGNYVDLAPTA
ncbi:zinc finger SWIM domain-containing protein [Candidatus Thiomargarita nelsonii]|uniref:Zinc finger SWIM domain-containing protein n=1 Tax=Candidatus Thiomargarita nelsonii TaxID=1003181 RepID=A0A176RVM6_9GAMM|nr:zinc finger SWIM domain-containing protein [Candidatus Thiomargarita nelsonii]